MHLLHSIYRVEATHISGFLGHGRFLRQRKLLHPSVGTHRAAHFLFSEKLSIMICIGTTVLQRMCVKSPPRLFGVCKDVLARKLGLQLTNFRLRFPNRSTNRDSGGYSGRSRKPDQVLSLAFCTGVEIIPRKLVAGTIFSLCTLCSLYKATITRVLGSGNIGTV